MAHPRIISLLPAATEIVYLLGLEKYLVGVSHDSDFPQAVEKLPKISSTVISQNWSSKKIDEAVRESKHQGNSVFHINQTLLQKLEPTLILTQELCSVCAPSYAQVMQAAKILQTDFTVISLEPESIEDIFENIKLIANYTDRLLQAKKEISSLKSRLASIGGQLMTRHPKLKTILIIEWLDPLMIAAHWVPEMVTAAGGKMLFAKNGEKSRQISWKQLKEIDPEILIIAPCGFTIPRTRQELSIVTEKTYYKTLKAVKNNRVYLMDGNAYLTRPGPRIIDGIEILAEIMNPAIFNRTYFATSWVQI